MTQQYSVNKRWVESNVEYEVHVDTSASGVSAVSRCVEALMSSSVRSSSDGPTMASRVSDTLEGRLDDCCIMWGLPAGPSESLSTFYTTASGSGCSTLVHKWVEHQY